MRKPPVKIKIGQQFGELTVLEWASASHSSKYKHYWMVKCSCGSITRKRADLIHVGRCSDCARMEQARQMLGKNVGENNSRYIKDRREVSIRRKIQSSCKKYKSTLSELQIRNLILSDCNYCGEVANIPKDQEGKYPVGLNGIDRVDSNRDYTLDNVVSCCKKCNYMKNELTVEEFLNHVQKISRHNKQE